MATDKPDAAEELVGKLAMCVKLTPFKGVHMDRLAALSLVREYGAKILEEAANEMEEVYGGSACAILRRLAAERRAP